MQITKLGPRTLAVASIEPGWATPFQLYASVQPGCSEATYFLRAVFFAFTQASPLATTIYRRASVHHLTSLGTNKHRRARDITEAPMRYRSQYIPFSGASAFIAPVEYPSIGPGQTRPTTCISIPGIRYWSGDHA